VVHAQIKMSEMSDKLFETLTFYINGTSFVLNRFADFHKYLADWVKRSSLFLTLLYVLRR
jgi:hypothetical protein